MFYSFPRFCSSQQLNQFFEFRFVASKSAKRQTPSSVWKRQKSTSISFLLPFSISSCYVVCLNIDMYMSAKTERILIRLSLTLPHFISVRQRISPLHYSYSFATVWTVWTVCIAFLVMILHWRGRHEKFQEPGWRAFSFSKRQEKVLKRQICVVFGLSTLSSPPPPPPIPPVFRVSVNLSSAFWDPGEPL